MLVGVDPAVGGDFLLYCHDLRRGIGQNTLLRRKQEISGYEYHYDKNGKVFTQNTTVSQENRLPLYFKWSHYSPIDQRVDPSATNIIDMIVITDSYYRDVTIWKNSNGSLSTFPPAPTTEELRIQFQELNQYKMVSDSMIWNRQPS